jgi:RNA polymerase II subunit A small phosphatase-like protein
MEDKSNKLIIFDLDETLIHATPNNLGINYHFKIDEYFVYERPHLKKFLVDISRHFSIGIWSSASDNYVNEIIQIIKPDNVDFLIVWGRSKCTLKRDITFDTYNHEKRLDKLKKKGFGLEQILIVDDSPTKSRANYGNAVYIKEFTGDATDNELIFLYNYLLKFKTVDNVRTIEKRGWRQ